MTTIERPRMYSATAPSLSELRQLVTDTLTAKETLPQIPWEEEVKKVISDVETLVKTPSPHDNQTTWEKTHRLTAQIAHPSPHVLIQAGFSLLEYEDSEMKHAGLTLLGSPNLAKDIVNNVAHYQRALQVYAGYLQPLEPAQRPQVASAEAARKPLQIEKDSDREFEFLRSVENLLILDDVITSENLFSLKRFIASHITPAHELRLEEVSTHPEMENTRISDIYGYHFYD